jgi:hypothetical protein
MSSAELRENRTSCQRPSGTHHISGERGGTSWFGSRSPAFASSMISLATVTVVGSLRSTNPSFPKAASNAVVKAATSSGPNQ